MALHTIRIRVEGDTAAVKATVAGCLQYLVNEGCSCLSAEMLYDETGARQACVIPAVQPKSAAAVSAPAAKPASKEIKNAMPGVVGDPEVAAKK